MKIKILTKFSIILLVFCTNFSVFAAQETNTETTTESQTTTSTFNVENLDPNANIGTLFVQKKEPFLAGFFSFLMMGTGQFYAGNFESGSLFLFSDIILKAMLVGLILHLKAEYTTETNDSVQWRQLNVLDRSLVLGYVIIYAIIMVANISDAVSSAIRYNRRYIRDPAVTFGFGADKNGFKLALTTSF